MGGGIQKFDFGKMCVYSYSHAPLAQLVEQSVYTGKVAGPSPAGRTRFKNLNCFRFFKTCARRSVVSTVARTAS